MPHKILTPHDIYFQNMMEIVTVAESFFKAHLPAQVIEAIDWSSFKIADSVRRASHGKATYTDITYLCYSHEGHGPIYFHVEQERNIDPFIIERMLGYNLRLFTKHRKQKKNKPPIISNFVLYNGTKSKKYPHHEDMYDYYDLPWLARLLMSGFFRLINLNEVSDETFSKQGSSGMMELLLKRADHINFVKWMQKEGASINLKGEFYLKDILDLSTDYVLRVGQDDADEIIRVFTELYPENREIIMTAARQLEQRGIQQGMQTRTLDIARSMLRAREPEEKVIQFTGLTFQQVEQLLSKLKK